MPVEITRKRIKNMYLRVRPPDGQVCVSAPRGMSESRIREFICSRLDWIEKQKELIRSQCQPQAWPPTTQLIWGEAKELLFSTAGACNLILDGSQLMVASPAPLSPESWNSLLCAFLRRLTAEAAPPLIALWSGKLGLPRPEVSIRHMKRRWGTCYPRRNKIILNSELATKPPACLEEVILHELLHFFKPNHGPEFRELMQKWLPDWRAISRLLDQ